MQNRTALRRNESSQSLTLNSIVDVYAFAPKTLTRSSRGANSLGPAAASIFPKTWHHDRRQLRSFSREFPVPTHELRLELPAFRDTPLLHDGGIDERVVVLRRERASDG